MKWRINLQEVSSDRWREGRCFLHWPGHKHNEQSPKTVSSSVSFFFLFPGQTDVPCFEDQRVGLRPKRHVFFLVGLCPNWWPPLEVRQWRMGAGWETRATKPQLRLHPPRFSQLWGPLDESRHFLQQSQTYQQAQWEWAGMAWCFPIHLLASIASTYQSRNIKGAFM